MRYLLGGLIAALLLVPPAADAGFAILDEAGHQTLLSRGRLKITPKGAGGIVMVLDVGRARMWVADAGRRVYWEGTVEQYCQEMRGAMSGAMAEMEKRMAEFGLGWKDATAVQTYTVHDFHPVFAEEMVRRGAARSGLTWHFARPPVVDLEYEMDCRRVVREIVI